MKKFIDSVNYVLVSSSISKYDFFDSTKFKEFNAKFNYLKDKKC